MLETIITSQLRIELNNSSILLSEIPKASQLKDNSLETTLNLSFSLETLT